MNPSEVPLTLLSLLAGPLLWMSPEVLESFQPAPSQGWGPLGFRRALWEPPEWAKSQASITQKQPPRGQGSQPCPVPALPCPQPCPVRSPALSAALGKSRRTRPLPWIREGTEAPAVLELLCPHTLCFDVSPARGPLAGRHFLWVMLDRGT